jgi:hypothetical protein
MRALAKLYDRFVLNVYWPLGVGQVIELVEHGEIIASFHVQPYYSMVNEDPDIAVDIAGALENIANCRLRGSFSRELPTMSLRMRKVGNIEFTGEDEEDTIDAEFEVE